MIVVCKKQGVAGLLDSVFDMEYTWGVLLETDFYNTKTLIKKINQLEGAGFEVLVVPIGVTSDSYDSFKKKYPDIHLTENYWPVYSSIPRGDFNFLGEAISNLFKEISKFVCNTSGYERI